MRREMIRAAVVGLGVGEQHVVSYQSIEGCKVHSICDLDEEKLFRVSKQYGVENITTDYRIIMADPDIDVVSICTYDDVHAEQAVAAFNGLKHVMIEKPIAVSLDQARAVKQAQAKAGTMITSNLILRKSPRFIELKRRIELGELGELYYLEGDYLHNVEEKIIHGWRNRISFYSPIYGGAIHLIDLVRWLANENVVEVCAMGSRKVTERLGNNFDDTNVLLMKFESGTIAKVGATLIPKHPKFHALQVLGTKASFINRLADADWFEDDDVGNRQSVTTPYPAMEKGDLLPAFVNAIRNDHEPEVGTEDVFHVMDICLAAQQSRSEGRFVSMEALSNE